MFRSPRQPISKARFAFLVFIWLVFIGIQASLFVHVHGGARSLPLSAAAVAAVAVIGLIVAVRAHGFRP